MTFSTVADADLPPAKDDSTPANEHLLDEAASESILTFGTEPGEIDDKQGLA